MEELKIIKLKDGSPALMQRQITLMEWEEKLEKAKKRLADSKKCYELFHDEDSKQWVEEDTRAVQKIMEQIKKVIDFYDAHGIY